MLDIRLIMKLTKKYTILMWMCCFAYAISYIGRLGYNANIPNIMQAYSLDKATTGIAVSAFFICYGAGQILNAIVCERFNSVITVSLSLLVSSILSVVMFFISNVIAMSILWGLNGLVLSALWCNLIKIVSVIKDDKYTSKSILVLAISLPIGTCIAYGVSSLLTYLNVWKAYYVFSAVLLAGIGVVFYLIVGKTLKDVNYLHGQNLTALNAPNTSESNNLNVENGKAITSQNSAVLEVEGQQIQKKSFFKFLSLAVLPFLTIAVFSSILKDGLTTWFSPYLNEVYNMPNYFSILLTFCLPLVGMLSTIFANFTVRKTKSIFKSFALMWILTVGLMAVLSFAVGVHVVIIVIVFALLNFLMHAVNSVLTAIFPLYYKKYILSGRVAGITNAFCYIGSAVSSFGLGAIIDLGANGWAIFMYLLLGLAGLSLVLSIIGELLFKKHNNAIK